MNVLKPFQIHGAQYLAARTRALLADEPGVGKTPQLIEAASRVGVTSFGVVCPEIGIQHWRREIKKWKSADVPWVVGIMPWGSRAVRDAALNSVMTWDVLVLDECHFGKNPQAWRTRAVYAKNGLAWRAKRIWAASGTPAPNHVGELWPMLRAFNKTQMDQEQFVRHFCHVDDQGKIRGNRADRIAELRGILDSFTLRRKKRDVLPELGEIDIQEWYVKPSAEFARGTFSGFHDAACQEAHLRAELEGKSAEDLLTFLAGDQEFATLRRYNALLKAPAVFETVKFELENGLLDKVVIYGYHKEALAALHSAFQRAGIGSVLIYGETPPAARDNLIEIWKRSGTVMLASIPIASTVLDFTCAHQGIMLELDWVPGNNLQAMQRMHRHGQQNPVTVRVAIGTPVDEIVSDVVLRKTRDLAEIFD